ncbi:helix-turn-helix domain-containing protein [Streptomyces sp. NPDC001698]|uniref:helix-turn-helix domain-containing protein n=1 Tax=unclassified Streptomyces TaxID=2593676 RepID=UPI0036B83F92
MPLVTKWTGREVKALREAVRMSIMEFAEKLGMSDRMFSRWEADSEQASLRMVNQAALDTLLAKADQDAQGRFVGILAVDNVPIRAIIEPDENQTNSGNYVKHPGGGKLMTHVSEGIFLSWPQFARSPRCSRDVT